MLPPSLPTSFVPRPAGSPPRHVNTDFTGFFGVVIYIVCGVIMALAAGVFAYERFLLSAQANKREQVTKANSSIDLKTVEGFIRLNDRLNSGQGLLEKHVALSNFFLVLESVIPSAVRFSTLEIAVNEKGDGATIHAAGVAKSLNALAAASSFFADDGRIKDAIFSKIVVNAEDDSISFLLAATIDKKLLAFSVDNPIEENATGAGAGVATTTTSI